MVVNGEGVGVDATWHVDPGTRVGVREPCPAHAGVLLDDGERHPGTFESHRRIDAGEAGTDDDNMKVLLGALYSASYPSSDP